MASREYIRLKADLSNREAKKGPSTPIFKMGEQGEGEDGSHKAKWNYPSERF
jgi:hypothetical protein